VPEGSIEAIKVITHPIGVGRLDWKTRSHDTVTARCEPTWTVPQSIRAEHAERGDILPRVGRSDNRSASTLCLGCRAT